MRRLRFALAAVGAVACTVVAAALIFTSDHDDRPWVIATLALPAGLAFITAGLVALWRRPENATGFYMTTTGFLWFIGALSESGSSWVWTTGFVLGNLAFVAFATLILAYPDGRLERRDALLVAVGGIAAIGSNLVLALTDETPTSCDGCPGSAVAVVDLPRVASLVLDVGTVVVVGVLLSITVILVRRWRRASTARRRLLWPVLATCGLVLVALVVSVVLERISEDAYAVFWPVVIVAFTLVPFAFLSGVLRSRLARSSATRILMALETGGDLHDAIATALGDPTVEVAYWIEQTETWVDRDGRLLEPPAPSPQRSVRVVERGAKRVAALVYDAALDVEPDIVDAVVAAVGYPLANERLQAESRAQYSFLVTLVDTAPSLFVHIDTDGQIRNQNAVAARVAGVGSEDEIRGRFFWDVFIAPEERREVIDRFEASRPAFSMGEYENTFTNALGEQRVIFWRAAPVTSHDGQVTGIISSGIDITARHEEAVARERERAFLNAIANEAPSLLCLVDGDGVLAPFATNKAFERTLEYAPDETGGHVFWERYVAPEDADDVERRIRAVAAGDTMSATDSTWVTKDGKELAVSWSCTRLPAIDERGLLLVSGVDVTDRRQRELDIQRERDATTTVLQAIPGVIAVLSREGRIRDRDVDNPLAAVNRAFKETLGWKDTELVGRDFLELVVDDDGSARAAVDAAAAGRTSDEVESEWRARDGSLVTVSWTASAVRDVTGRTDGLVLVSGVDITERRARELEDARRRAFIDAITETIPSYIVAVHPDATIRSGGVNDAFEQAFGWTAEEIAGRSFVGCVTPESDYSARMVIANAAGGAPQAEIESRWDARDGESRIVAWTARPVVGIKGEQLVLVSGSDVTVRRLQEEQIRASRQRIVAAADEARRKLERNLHDGAQQRLVALSVSLRLAESKLESDPAAVGELLGAAREELSLALAELRELARGIHPAVLTDRGLVPALEALSSRAPLPVELDVPSDALPADVEAAVYYVVAEALTNVAKYAHATSARVTVERTGAVVAVSVEDDGIGGATPSPGSGLSGLVDRVAALDGTLAIESDAGVGTCVRAEIPLRGDDTSPS